VEEGHLSCSDSNAPVRKLMEYGIWWSSKVQTWRGWLPCSSERNQATWRPPCRCQTFYPCEPLCSCAAVVSPASVLSTIDIYLAAQPANKPPTIRRHSSFIDLREHVQLATQAALVNTSSLCPRAHEYIII
jgi:hypothetical protein